MPAGLLAAAATAFAGLPPATAAARPSTVRCAPVAIGHGPGPRVTVSATATPCAQARTLVMVWDRRAGAPHSPCLWVDQSRKPGACTVQGWHCLSYHTTNGQNYPVVCERPRRRVRFIHPV